MYTKTYQSRDQLSLGRFDQIELGSTHILSCYVCQAIVGSNPSCPASLPSYPGTRDLPDLDAEIFCALRRISLLYHYHMENQLAVRLSNKARKTIIIGEVKKIGNNHSNGKIARI